MRLRGLLEPLENSTEFKGILKGVEGKKYPIGVYGASESGKGYLIGGLFESLGKSIVIVTQSDMEAKNLYEDLLLYTNEVYYFPAREMVFYNIDAISGDLRWARLKIINEILNKTKKIIVTSIDAFCAKYTPRKLFKEYTFQLKIGDEIDLKEITKKLVE